MTVHQPFIDELLSGTTTRSTRICEIEAAVVEIQRTGKPLPDLSGFDITRRRVVVGIRDKTWALTAPQARELARALLEAVDIIAGEEIKGGT